MEEDTEKNEGKKRRKILEFKGTEEKGRDFLDRIKFLNSL